MKPGKILDTEIALKVLKQKITDPYSVVEYSTNEFNSYLVVNKLQSLGWSCNLKSYITSEGNLSYKCTFLKDKKYASYRHYTIPMSICMAALSVVNKEYIEEYSTVNIENVTDNTGEIIQINKKVQSAISVDIENNNDDIIDALIDIIKSSKFTMNSGSSINIEKLLHKLHRLNIIPEDLKKIFIIQLSQKIIDGLNEHGYNITKK